MAELKPCPFCGGTARVETVANEIYVRYYICCYRCMAKTEYSLTESLNKERTIEAWNRRTNDVQD